MKFDLTMYKGNTNTELRVTYSYNYEQSGQFQTVRMKSNGSVAILPSFGISISEGYERPYIFITSNKYYPFIALLSQSLKLISDNLYEIFPNINGIEFEVDSRVMERFQTEKAMSTAGMTAMPVVWTDSNSVCYPAIRITSLKNGSITIPLEDAKPIEMMLKGFNPFNYGISLLNLFDKLN